MHSLVKHLQKIQKHKLMDRTEYQETITWLLEPKSEKDLFLRGKQVSFFSKGGTSLFLYC